MSMRLASTFVLVLGIAVFADSALAGNGQGNGNGNTPAAAASAGGQDSSPGNSANAPGQAKKDAGPASSEPAAPADVGGTEASSPAADGVKPSSESDHDTHEAASSDRTKQYGNGRTAGEIAIQHGAAPSTILHGPGNSQPHKAAPCSGGHEIDVHALKGKGHQGSCGPTASPPSKPVPTGNPETNRSSDPRAAGGDPARPSETHAAAEAPFAEGARESQLRHGGVERRPCRDPVPRPRDSAVHRDSALARGDGGHGSDRRRPRAPAPGRRPVRTRFRMTLQAAQGFVSKRVLNPKGRRARTVRA